LRNSRNNQWTLGAISKINYKVSDDIKVTVGGDWRTAEIEHYYEVRDLLGGEYFINKDNQFDTEAEWKKGLGDKLYYFNTNTVDWFGFFGQSEYKSARISAYGMAGYSMIKYSYTDHFTKMSDGSELFTEADWISGMQIKGGASYKVTSGIDVYANAGYVSKVPIFDNVINDYDGSKADDPKNEKFISLEGGVNFFGLLDNTLTTKLSIYHTTWKDRAWTIGVQKADGSDALVFLSGMNALHQGIELEAAYQPMRLFRFDFATGIGNWKQTDDVSGLYKDYSAPAGQESQEYHLYVKNLKVGDSPQTQFALAATVYPIPDLYAQLVVRHYRDNYANYDLFSRVDPNDRAQSWQAPNYTVVDLHAAYNLPFELAGIKFQLFGHVFNLLDEIYVQDALDNSPYNAYRIDHDNNPATAKVIANPHKADAAEVFLGLPRTFNLGLSLRY